MPRGVAERGDGFPLPEGPWGLGREERAQCFPCPISWGSLPDSWPRPGPTLSEAPSRPCWSWGHRREAWEKQERHVGGALQDGRRRGAEGFCPAHSIPGKPAEHPGQVPCPPKPPPGYVGPGGIGGRPRGEQEWQAGRAQQDQRSRKRAEPRKSAGLPGGVPHPLRPEAGGTPGSHLFLNLSPTPYPSHTPGPFPALWVLIRGPAHHPSPTPA